MTQAAMGALMDATPSAGMVYAAASPWWLAGVIAATGMLGLAHYRALPLLAPSPANTEEMSAAEIARTPLPRVSIIVPARNEERTLPTLLTSLLALDYQDYEVLVVNDNSTDGTARVVEEFAQTGGGRIRLLAAAEPPAGWTGKNNACATGARAASGTWLLFTDADTEHRPESLRAALTTALGAGARALSLFPQQRCHTFWERLLLPFAFQQLFVGVRPAMLTAPSGPALANGQYILVARDAYLAAGGHAAVAGNVLDDVALAGALKREGTPVLVCRGERLVGVRMYESLGAIAEGFSKNSFQVLGEQGIGGALVFLSTACAAGVLPTLAVALAASILTRFDANAVLAFVGAVLAYLLQIALTVPWLRACGVPRRYAVFAPFAALVFTLIAVSSAAHVILRRPVTWKGRAYDPAGAGNVAAPAAAQPIEAGPRMGDSAAPEAAHAPDE